MLQTTVIAAEQIRAPRQAKLYITPKSHFPDRQRNQGGRLTRRCPASSTPYAPAGLALTLSANTTHEATEPSSTAGLGYRRGSLIHPGTALPQHRCLRITTVASPCFPRARPQSALPALNLATKLAAHFTSFGPSSTAALARFEQALRPLPRVICPIAEQGLPQSGTYSTA